MGFGIFGGGETSSTSSQTTYEQGTQFAEQGDESQQFANYGSATGGGDFNLNLTDNGAVNSAISLAEKSIGSVEAVSRDAVGSVSSSASSAVNSAVQATRSAIDKVVQNAESESGKLATKAGIFLLIALGGYVAIKRFS